MAMTKKSIRIIAIIIVAAVLSAGLGLSAWALFGRGKPASTEDGNRVIVLPGTESLSEVSGGVVTTRYKIVIPDGADNDVKYAAAEMAALFNEAAGARPETVTDKDPAQSGEHFLSVGRTKQWAERGFDASRNSLSDNGYAVKTSGKAAYLFGATGKGTINAVYGFCEQVFGYEFFASDEYVIERKLDSKLPVMDILIRPDIANFAPMYGEMYKEISLFSSLKAVNYYDTWIAGLQGHTYFKLLPPAVYEDEHKDWYSPERNDNGEPANLCLTRSPEMKAEFIRQVKLAIESDPDRRYMMLGQEDNFGFCGSDSCLAEIKRYEGSQEIKYGSAAVTLRFTNDVVREVNAWLAAEHPERDITFVMFAYNHTKNPPVVFNAKTNGYDPVDPSLIAEKNLAVMFVINNVDYFKPYAEDESVVRMLNGWSALTENLMIWQYGVNFDDYFDTFCNWGSMGPNYNLLKEYGASYIIEQAAHNSATGYFAEMRMWLQSKLCWDTSLKTGDLIDKFLRVYYKDAYEKVRAYFDLVNNHTAALVADKGVQVRSGGNEMMSPANWSPHILSRMVGLLDEAYAAVAPLQGGNPELYRKLQARILKLTIAPRYNILRFYPPADYSVAYAALENDARSVGITTYHE
jgi:hypothetical protein